MRARPTNLLRLLGTAALLVATCLSAGISSASAAASTATATGKQSRLVALGEEALLADLLDLGVPVAASTANQAELGFQGMVADTDGIEILTSTDMDLEDLAALEPDRIVVTDFWLQYASLDTLKALADDVTVIDTSGTWRQDYLQVAKAFGKTKLARKHLATYDRKVRQARTALATGDRTVSLAAVYPGGNVAIWVEPGIASSDVLTDLGFELVPSDAGAAPDAQGRVYVSTERLDLLTGDDLVLLASPQLDGEEAALREIESSALWKRIPAVAADRVVEVDRLGFNGVAGRTQLVDALRRDLRT